MKKMLKISSMLAIIAGIVLVVGGVGGFYFVYKNVAQENITTPADASISDSPVRGPLTLKSQAEIIRTHTLKTTGGKTFAEMPGQVPKLDENGNPILDVEGKPVTTANTARNIWITATTLITALNLGIIAYAFSGLVFLFGLFSVWIGIVLLALSRKY